MAGDGEHQIEVDILEAGLAEEVKSRFGLRGGVGAAEGAQEGVVPGLHAHADAVDAEGLKEGGFGGRDGGGVHFESPLSQLSPMEE